MGAYSKFIVAVLSTALVAAQTLPGGPHTGAITSADWLTIISAALGAIGVWAVQNVPPTPPAPPSATLLPPSATLEPAGAKTLLQPPT